MRPPASQLIAQLQQGLFVVRRDEKDKQSIKLCFADRSDDAAVKTLIMGPTVLLWLTAMATAVAGKAAAAATTA